MEIKYNLKTKFVNRPMKEYGEYLGVIKNEGRHKGKYHFQLINGDHLYLTDRQISKETKDNLPEE